jgi:hypothetical protein
MQHEHHHGRVEPAIVDGERFELAAAKVDVVELLEASASALEHGC